MNGTASLYRDLTQRVASGEPATFDGIEAILIDLDSGVYGDVPADDSVRDLALDCFEAISELERDDPAHLWNHAHRLAKLGHPGEAAQMFIRAAALARQEAHEGTGIFDAEDSKLWGESALYHATKQFLLARRPLTAAVVAQRIEDEAEREDARALLDKEVSKL